jgi:hypothetical protein
MFLIDYFSLFIKIAAYFKQNKATNPILRDLFLERPVFWSSPFRSLGHVDSHSSLVGYCPQEDALDDLVTVEEHLYFYARVHGIPEKDIKDVSIYLEDCLI